MHSWFSFWCRRCVSFVETVSYSITWAPISIRPTCVRVRRGFVCVERDARDARARVHE